MRNCSYCGSAHEIQRDHVIPNSYLRSNRRKFKGDWVVPSCGECNNILQDNLIFSIPDRALFLYKKYLKRYSKVLSFPAWSEEELEEVSSRFKESILASVVYRGELQNRLEHLKLVSSMDEDYLYPE